MMTSGRWRAIQASLSWRLAAPSICAVDTLPRCPANGAVVVAAAAAAAAAAARIVAMTTAPNDFILNQLFVVTSLDTTQHQSFLIPRFQLSVHLSSCPTPSVHAYIILRHWQSTASSLSQPSPSVCATSSSNFWLSGLRCCWSDGVELSTWQFT